MTTPPSEVTLTTLSDKLEDLTKRFDMRFAKGREQAQTIEDLQTRLTRAERAASATSIKPLVDGLSLVIERLHQGDATPEFLTSIGSELEYVLESIVGVVTISANAGDPVDRLRHEVTTASGEGTEIRVAELVRTGYEKDGVVLRPAKVTAIRVAESEIESGGDE